MDVNTKSIADFFGSLAHKYDAHTQMNEYGIPAFVERRLSSLAPAPNVRILDLACGNGNIAAVFKRICPRAEITGLDLSPQMIEEAAKNAVYSATHVHDLGAGLPRSLVEKPTYFDFVLAYGVMECVADISPMLTDIAAVLKPSGQFWTGFDQTLEHDDPQRVRSALGFRTFQRGPDEIESLTASAGLKKLYQENISAYKRSFDRKIIPYLMLELEISSGDSF